MESFGFIFNGLGEELRDELGDAFGFVFL